MNRKALQLAISTIILLVIGIFVLIGIVYLLTGGLERFRGTTDPFIDSSQLTAIKTACQDSCSNEVPLAYCCSEYEVDDYTVRCDDPRLEVECSISCAAVSCPASE